MGGVEVGRSGGLLQMSGNRYTLLQRVLRAFPKFALSLNCSLGAEWEISGVSAFQVPLSFHPSIAQVVADVAQGTGAILWL